MDHVTKDSRLNTRITDVSHKRIAQLAKQEQRSFSDMVRLLLADSLQRFELRHK